MLQDWQPWKFSASIRQARVAQAAVLAGVQPIIDRSYKRLLVRPFCHQALLLPHQRIVESLQAFRSQRELETRHLPQPAANRRLLVDAVAGDATVGGIQILDALGGDYTAKQVIPEAHRGALNRI